MSDTRDMVLVPRGGRPAKDYPSTYWLELIEERRSMTLKQMAALHNCSVSYMSRLVHRAEDECGLPRNSARIELQPGDGHGQQ